MNPSILTSPTSPSATSALASPATPLPLPAPPPPGRLPVAPSPGGSAQLIDDLHSLGIPAEEELCDHVGLGKVILFATSARFVCVLKPSWILLWHVEYKQVEAVEVIEGASAVTLKLRPSMLPERAFKIECMTTAIVPLVHEMAASMIARKL